MDASAIHTGKAKVFAKVPSKLGAFFVILAANGGALTVTFADHQTQQQPGSLRDTFLLQTTIALLNRWDIPALAQHLHEVDLDLAEDTAAANQETAFM